MKMFWDVRATYSDNTFYRFRVDQSANFLKDMEAIEEELIMHEKDISGIVQLKVTLSS